uniref:Uncharacterized protein n=1 Tax=Onchocerca volvulus TaxID=6282 RepID=A0A8R1XWZ3_ONCVO
MFGIGVVKARYRKFSCKNLLKTPNHHEMGLDKLPRIRISGSKLLIRSTRNLLHDKETSTRRQIRQSPIMCQGA